MLTCFSILVEAGVFGVLEQGQALLNGCPHVGLWTQQVRGPVLTLGRGKDGKKNHKKRAVISVAQEHSGYNLIFQRARNSFESNLHQMSVQ